MAAPFVACRSLRHQLHKWIIGVLLIFSIGGHWAILQSGAWVGMFISFSQNDSVVDAMVKTFDGNHPCKVCEFVAAGKKSEKKHEHQWSKVKIDFFLVEHRPYSWNPRGVELRFDFASIGPEKTYSPPTPPPRYS